MKSAITGSSPLARGLRRLRRYEGVEDRIIPARAGFTTCRSGCAQHHSDHPRSRGVYKSVCVHRNQNWGSSPLARGLRPRQELRGKGDGIIPARAGFTTHSSRKVYSASDHPRSRGVYQRTLIRSTHSCGSSPLARGLPIQAVADRPRGGIIPARAGFTPSASLRRSTARDHPRSRGVYVVETTTS